jgi:hypothetical protein
VIPYKLLVEVLQVDGGSVHLPKSLLEFLLRQILIHAEFDEETYLRMNPDVAASVRKGEWPQAKDHYIASGYFEGRAGATKTINEAWYLRVNPDVAEAVRSGEWLSGESHYNEKGLFEWRAPNKELREVFSSWRMALQPRYGAMEEIVLSTESVD